MVSSGSFFACKWGQTPLFFLCLHVFLKSFIKLMESDPIYYQPHLLSSASLPTVVFANAVCIQQARQKMNVIRHPHIPMNRQTKPPCRLDQCIAKELIVRVGSENGLPVVAALDDVLRLTGDDESGRRAI
jgi:hypothetical protein